MISRIPGVLCFALLVFVRISPAPALAYDKSWYRTDFWSGEYPHGFTMEEDVTTRIRPEPNPDTPRVIDCALEKGATYHPWNAERVASSKLEFISFVPKVTYEIKAPVTISLRNEQTETDVKIFFGAGDEWTYLTYYAEGTFRMFFKGKTYGAEQDLIEASREKGSKAAAKDRVDDEWMKLTCANGASGWLLLGDVLGQPAYDSFHFIEYGVARDKIIAVTSPAPEPVSLPAVMWPVGKWPEGIVHDGKSLWIAESARRRIAQLDIRNGRVLKLVRVGRLPVDMAATSDGRVFSLVYTDQLVWTQPKSGRGKRLARLKDYPEGMVNDDRTLWVLTHPGGSSAQTKVVRLDQRSGKAHGSEDLGKNGSDLVVVNDKLWVVHPSRNSTQLSLLDPGTLAGIAKNQIDGLLSQIAANDHGIFASGGEWDRSGLVVKFDGESGTEITRRTLPRQFVRSLAADENHVIAIGRQGTIWILSPKDLSVLREINLSIGQFEPSGLLPLGDRLYVTTHRGQKGNGSVVVVKDWRP